MQQRSTFVTVVAWVFIVLSAFATLIGVIQNILVWTVFRVTDMSAALQQAQGEMPAEAAMFAALVPYMPFLFLGFLLVCVVMLISSIGLLRRWNPARLCFIGLMILGALWNVAGLVFQFFVLGFIRQEIADLPADELVEMQSIFNAALIGNGLFVLAFVVLFLWIAKRLLSPEIAAEFRH